MALLLASLATVSGCSSGSSSADGPLGSAIAEGTAVCVPVKTGKVLSFGADSLHNSGSVDVVIDGVSLTDAQGLSLDQSFIVPVRNIHFGVEDYPPTVISQGGVQWADRRHAAGATLAPEPEDEAEESEATAAATQSAAPAETENESTDDDLASPDEVPVQQDLLLAIKVTGKNDVRMSGVVVNYHAGNKKFVWRNLTELTVQTKKSSC